MTTAGWRDEIQVLRGWAVLVVVLFHSGLGVAPSGFLGVDMFFVVSGYLITGNVRRAKDAGTFRTGRFYQRRIRRLWPAAFLTLMVTTIAAALLLTPTAQVHFREQLLGSLVFSTNVVLWRQINYFHDSAAVEPLLHFWSLAVEEQYYLLLPFALAMILRRRWLSAISAATLTSLGAFLWFYPESPGAVFYLLPTRAWELGVGCAIALLPEKGRLHRLAYHAAPGAALALLALPFVKLTPTIGYWLTVPACAATAALLLAERSPGRRAAVLGWLGDRSYAIYLVHWPPVAFAYTIWLGMTPPPWIGAALIVGSIAVGATMHALIERPALRLPLSPRWWAALGAGSLLVAATATLAPHLAGMATKRVDLQPVSGLSLPACDQDGAAFDSGCRSGDHPRMLLWGDSFSQHLVPGLQATTPVAFAQASKGGCPPLPGLAPVDLQASEAVARDCIAYGNSVLAWLTRSPWIEVVVLSGSYLRYTWPGVRVLDRNGRSSPPTFAMLVDAQRALAAQIRAMGKRVILVSAPPQSAFDAGQCQERRTHHLPVAGARADCAITPATRLPGSDWLTALMTNFAATGTPVLDLDRALCRDGVCPTSTLR